MAGINQYKPMRGKKMLESWEKATIKPGSFKKKIKRLLDKKYRQLDQVADRTHKRVFDELDCLECANCCKSIPPILVRTDIRRISRFLGMNEKDFEKKYLLRDEDEDLVMRSSPCVFLDKDNLCEIYDVRPKACREYPHTDGYAFRRNAHLHARNANYCPGVYHIVKQLEAKYLG